MAKKANGILACIRKCGRDCPSALGTGEATPRVLCQVLAFHFKKEIEMLKHVQQRAAKLMKGLESLSCEEQLKELGLLV